MVRSSSLLFSICMSLIKTIIWVIAKSEDRSNNMLKLVILQLPLSGRSVDWLIIEDAVVYLWLAARGQKWETNFGTHDQPTAITRHVSPIFSSNHQHTISSCWSNRSASTIALQTIQEFYHQQYASRWYSILVINRCSRIFDGCHYCVDHRFSGRSFCICQRVRCVGWPVRVLCSWWMLWQRWPRRAVELLGHQSPDGSSRLHGCSIHYCHDRLCGYFLLVDQSHSNSKQSCVGITCGHVVLLVD